MNKKVLISAAGIAVSAVILTALPSHSAGRAAQDSAQQRVRALKDALSQEMSAPQARDFEFSFGDASWLGVETSEVTSDKAKELKLPAERGVVVGKILDDSPAAKAGLKANDVITEINGQRVEGTAQFRRMIREIPAGRAVQLTVWRNGQAQQIAATLGKSEEDHNRWLHAGPGSFAFTLPEVSELAPLPEIDLDSEMLGLAERPRLGIDAEDLSGQLGAFFGAPEGDGILVRDVTSGSVAEKAGLKAGDVIVSLNGERLRSVGDLRAKLAQHAAAQASDKAPDKATDVKLGIIRNRAEMSVTAQLPPMTAKPKRTRVRQTNI